MKTSLVKLTYDLIPRRPKALEPRGARLEDFTILATFYETRLWWCDWKEDR